MPEVAPPRDRVGRAGKEFDLWDIFVARYLGDSLVSTLQRYAWNCLLRRDVCGGYACLHQLNYCGDSLAVQ